MNVNSLFNLRGCSEYTVNVRTDYPLKYQNSKQITPGDLARLLDL